MSFIIKTIKYFRRVRSFYSLAFIFSLFIPLKAFSKEKVGQVYVEVLNDVLFQRDKDYTSGVLLSWTPKARPFTFRLGQDLYTPTNLSTSVPINFEHPYAAWSFVGLNYKQVFFKDFLASFTLDVGTTGPRALGKETQVFVHSLIKTTDPKGWDSQIFNQWGFIADLKLGYRIPFLSVEHDLISFRVVPYLRASTGNLLQEYGIGGEVVIGHNLADYSAYLYRKKGFGWSVQANYEQRYVQKNVFLEGNTKYTGKQHIHSYGVVPKDSVTRAGIGIFFGYSNIELGFTVRYETQTYISQRFERTGVLSKINRNIVPDGDYITGIVLKVRF